ncbi:MAG TPA: FAD binding domain-containing protein [Longimicrobiales bacterium]|nr:FAD binding domain-containing protein [Longimicrobiales bacterium]
MLRLPPFTYHRPDRVDDAVELLGEHGAAALPVAGGTDLIPNMKHRLFEPAHLVSLTGIPDLGEIAVGDEEVVLGAAVTLSRAADHPEMARVLPSLAEAAGLVAGPQIRNRGTLGGNLCLDTRCTYYNQTEFWRHALGYCLKKDGEVCHVTRVGKKCVAAHSADTPPVLMTLDAVADLQGPGGARTVPVRDFFVADGIWNTRREPGEIVVRIRVPRPAPGTRLAYLKLRQRKSIDFPLLSVAVAARLDPDGRVEDLRGVVTALGSRPRELSGWDEIAVGEKLRPELCEALAERAFRQCHPLENIIVDPDWRRAMVPVYVRRALGRIGSGGPVAAGAA